MTLAGLCGEIDALKQSLEQKLPKGWIVENRVNELVVMGPKVQAIWPVSLPSNDPTDETLWRDLSIVLQVTISIKWQDRLSDSKLDELRDVQQKYNEIMKNAKSSGTKSALSNTMEYGALHLPDYLSKDSAIFVHNNIAGYWVRPHQVTETVATIDKELSSRFTKVRDKQTTQRDRDREPHR